MYTLYKIFDINGIEIRTYNVPQYILPSSAELKVNQIDLLNNTKNKYYVIATLDLGSDLKITLVANGRNNFIGKKGNYILELRNNFIILGVLVDS